MSGVDLAAVAAERRYRPNPADVHRLAPNRDEQLFLVLSIFIGIISGLLVVCFRVAISWIQVLTLGSSPHPGQLRLFFVPMGVGLLVAALVQLVFPGARGSGINQTKAALYIYNGYISFKTVIGKFITSALSIGGGFSLGPEDPSLQIGAGVASMVSRRLNLSRERLRMFAPIGAAAGLAAASTRHLGHSFRSRRGDRTVERGRTRLHRAGRDLQCRGRAHVLGRGADVSHSLGNAEGPAGTSCLRRSGRGGGIASLIFSKALGYLPAAAAPASPLDLVYPAAHRRPHRGRYRLFWRSSGDGTGI